MSGKKGGNAPQVKAAKKPTKVGIASAAKVKAQSANLQKSPHMMGMNHTVVQAKDRAPGPFPIDKRLGLSLDVPDCITMYADSLIDPFNTHAGVCIPSELFPIPSSKAKLYRRGRFNAGTTGFGFIRVLPNTSNDGIAITHTNALSVGGAATVFSAFTVLTSSAFTQAPYATAAFTAPGVISRVAAVGLRIKYIGKLMDRNGMVVGIEDPDHQEVVGLTYDGLLASPYSMPKRVGDDEWDMSICYSGPVNPTDVDFVPGSAYPLGSTGFLLIGVSGVNGDQFEYEVVEHVEYAGTVVVNKSPSHADPGLFAKVVETAKTLTIDKPLQPEQSGSFWPALGEAIQSTIPKIIDIGGKALTGFKSGGLMGGLFGGISAALGYDPSRKHLEDGSYDSKGRPRIVNFSSDAMKPLAYGENPGGKSLRSHELRTLGNKIVAKQNSDSKQVPFRYVPMITSGTSF